MRFKDYVEEFEALDRRYGVGDIVLDRLQKTVGDRKVLVCTIGYTGTKHFEAAVKPRFDARGINYEERQLPEKDKKEKGRHYRPFDADPQDLKSDAEILMLFDGIIEDGGTMAGASVWALENLQVLGQKRILSLVIKDNKGIANYSFVPTFFRDSKYVGPAGAIELLAPPDKASKVRGRAASYLSNENPYSVQVFEDLKEEWREEADEEADQKSVLSASQSSRIVPPTEAQRPLIFMPATLRPVRSGMHVTEDATDSMIPQEDQPTYRVGFNIQLFFKRIMQTLHIY